MDNGPRSDVANRVCKNVVVVNITVGSMGLTRVSNS